MPRKPYLSLNCTCLSVDTTYTACWHFVEVPLQRCAKARKLGFNCSNQRRLKRETKDEYCKDCQDVEAGKERQAREAEKERERMKKEQERLTKRAEDAARKQAKKDGGGGKGGISLCGGGKKK